MIQIVNFTNNNRSFIAGLGAFRVLEYVEDISVSPSTAMQEYYKAEMNVRRKQLVIELNGSNSAVIQAGAMQWYTGNLQSTTGVKGVGDFVGKLFKGAVTKESAIKPEYTGVGTLVLEPTYKHILLEDVSAWGAQGMSIDDGMFLAADNNVKIGVVPRKTVSSALAGGEGLFNLSLSGSGVVALESNVPREELIEIILDNDILKVDGNFAVCWSSRLQFTVERSSKTLIGSAASGEGLVNVFRGTGKVLLSPVGSDPVSELASSLQNSGMSVNVRTK